MYKVSQGVFVDGSIIDAKDFLNEFGAVASEMASMDSALSLKISTVEATAKQYTDNKINTLNIDGGSF